MIKRSDFVHFHFGLVEVFYKGPAMDYRKMIVWQKAMNLTEAVYVAIRKLPPAELYALSAQNTSVGCIYSF